MLWFFLYGCCSNAPAPILTEPLIRHTEAGGSISYTIDELVVDSTLMPSELQFDAWTDNEDITLIAKEDGFDLIADTLWQGRATVNVEVQDSCDTSSSIAFDVEFGDPNMEIGENACPILFNYSSDSADNIVIAGDFNDWNVDTTPMTKDSDGGFTQILYLDPGTYSYKMVELDAGQPKWNCDPNAALKQCDAGQDPMATCVPEANSCNSMIIVPDCKKPQISIDALSLSEDEQSLSFGVQQSNGPRISQLIVQFDERSPIEINWDGDATYFDMIDEIEPGRHRLMLYARDANGIESNSLSIPFWTQDDNWRNGVMYFAFVDRFYNGDTTNDVSYGASHDITDYMGGDWAGTMAKLPYLADLGVTALWLTAPLNNADGVYGGKCDLTYTGYHGYWPTDSRELEPIFGNEETLRLLIKEAHRLGMRVLFDWVGNHVHEDHPHYSDHPDWFTPSDICEDANNWNDKPETCWFAPYLPTLAYKSPDVHATMIQEAMELAHRFDIDGFRVDAVKHIPKDVHLNFQTTIAAELEHSEHWDAFDFYTVGETFSGDFDLLNSYIGQDMLDGQFNFDLYWKILSAIGREEAPLWTLNDAAADAREAFGDALMCQFIGNHDVERFISHASGEVLSLYGDGGCPNGTARLGAAPPNTSLPYLRLMNAWTWLLTQPEMALIYTGDEIGLPGYHDPDNRQMMKFENELNSFEQMTLSHVQVLSQARQNHPEIHQGDSIEWWGRPDPDVLATAKSSQYGHSISIINRKQESVSLLNGLEWAGLPVGGQWKDILSGEIFTASGDDLSIDIPASTSRVLIWITD